MTPQMIADQFAESAPIGTPCRYFSVKPFEGDGFQTKIRSAPWVLGSGHVVVKVEGKAGGVSIEHIVFDVPAIRAAKPGER